LLQGNDLFILDEPFNGVDIQSNIIITEIIRKLKSLGKTLLISSHIFSTLKDTCDEIRLLEDGIFVERVRQKDFDTLEQAMVAFTVGGQHRPFGVGIKKHQSTTWSPLR
jgi:ABC-2 type transport system ATP-binding protein